ncbi:MAG: SPOR domain-containing protein [Bacteroidota bacterium]
MIIRFIIRFVLTVILYFPLNSSGQTIDPGPLKDYCANSEEEALYNLINNYRRINRLPAIPFSRSLSYVARIHAIDLSLNRPDFGGCNPHSWSAKGNWKPCCYAHDKSREICMNEKPKEITGYKSKGWEMVYSAGEEARATDAFDLWKGLGLANDYLLNTGKWIKPWKALGIGFYGDYACVWFGEGDDTEKNFGLCTNDSISKQEPGNQQNELVLPGGYNKGSDVTHVFYIITGSLNNQEKAYNEVQRLRNQGYAKARTIVSGDNFRISVNEFPTEREAQTALPALQKIFPGAWVLKPGE